MDKNEKLQKFIERLLKHHEFELKNSQMIFNTIVFYLIVKDGDFNTIHGSGIYASSRHWELTKKK
jgi:hypothetical protein